MATGHQRSTTSAATGHQGYPALGREAAVTSHTEKMAQKGGGTGKVAVNTLFRLCG